MKERRPAPIRIFSLWLALILCFTGFPLIPSASADDAPSPYVDARQDGTYRLNGINAKLSGSMTIGTSVSAEIWAKSGTPTWNDDGFLMSARSDNGFILHPVKDTKTVDVYIMVSNGGLRLAKSPVSFTVDDIQQWHHYAISFDFSNGTNVSLYLDGTFVGKGKPQTNVTFARLNNNPTVTVTVGSDMGSRYGNVEVDEVRVWSRAISGDQIARDKDRRLTGNESGLGLYWNFDTRFPSSSTGDYVPGTRDPASQAIFYEDQGASSVPAFEIGDTGYDAAQDDYLLSLSSFSGRLKFGSTATLASVVGNDSHDVQASGTAGGLNAALQSLFYQPDADLNGPDTVTLSVYHNATGASSAPLSYPVIIQPVNDAPSFQLGSDITVSDDAGPQNVPEFATNISAGPGETQNLGFEVTNGNEGLFAEQPTIDASGTLQYRPKPGALGIATVTVRLIDDGGTALGGINSSEQTFRITVTRANASPIITDNPALRLGGSEAVTIGSLPIGINFTAEVWARSLTPTWNENGFLLSSRNKNGFILHPNKGSNTLNAYIIDRAGSMEFSLPDFFSPADITQWHHYALRYHFDEEETGNIYVDAFLDGVKTNTSIKYFVDSRRNTASIALNAGKDEAPPTRFGSADIDEVRIWNRALSDDEIREYASRSNLDGVEWTTEKTKPLLYWNMDGINGGVVPDLSGNNRNGTLTGLANPAAGPELREARPAWQAITEDVPGTVQVTRFLDPDVGDTRFTLALEAGHGSASLTDASGLTIEEGAAGAHRIAYSGTSEALNAALATLIYEPDTNANGPDSVTMTVTDSGNGVPAQTKSSSRSFGLTVKAVNDSPSFAKGTDQTVEIDAPAQIVAGWATGLSAGPPDEAGQQLTFLVGNDHPELFLDQPSIDPDGTLRYRPKPGATGEATVSVILKDDGGTSDGGIDESAAQSFRIRVVPKSDDPVPSPSPEQSPSPAPEPAPDEQPTYGSFDVYANAISEGNLGDLVSVVVPQGAVQQDGKIDFRVMPVSRTPAFPGHTPLTPAVELTSTAGRTFAVPVQISFRYDPKLGRSSPSFIPAVFYYNDTLQRWIYEGGTVNVDGTVTVRVNHFTKFAVFEARQAAFSDLRRHWALPYVQRLAGMDVIDGFPDGRFRPDETVTRAQFARMLSIALGLKASSSVPREFLDQGAIPTWAREDVAAVTQAGLMRGYSLKNEQMRFGPDQPITRAELAVIAANVIQAYSIPEGHSSIEFKDADVFPTWAESSLHAAAATGLMSGDPDGAFRPVRPTTRAEAAALLYRLLDIMVDR